MLLKKVVFEREYIAVLVPDHVRTGSESKHILINYVFFFFNPSQIQSDHCYGDQLVATNNSILVLSVTCSRIMDMAKKAANFAVSKCDGAEQDAKKQGRCHFCFCNMLACHSQN